MESLNEKELDISMAQGFLEEWLKDAPAAVKEHLELLVSGISFYREKCSEAQEDRSRTLDIYNQLVAQSALYLQSMQQQREQIDQLLIETQREFHNDNSNG